MLCRAACEMILGHFFLGQSMPKHPGKLFLGLSYMPAGEDPDEPKGFGYRRVEVEASPGSFLDTACGFTANLTEIVFDTWKIDGVMTSGTVKLRSLFVALSHDGPPLFATNFAEPIELDPDRDFTPRIRRGKLTIAMS